MSTKDYAKPFHKREMEDAEEDKQRHLKTIAEKKRLAKELGVNPDDYKLVDLRKMINDKHNQ